MKWHAVVLSTRERPERLAGFFTRWEQVSDQPCEVDYGRLTTPGYLGCWDGHLRILGGHLQPLAIFEDDAVFADDFTLDVDPPADLTWLGGQHLALPLPRHDEWVQPVRINRTHAYLVREPQRIYHALRDRVPQHVDVALDTLTVRKLAAAPFTVGQGPGPSDIRAGYTAQSTRFWND